MIRTELELDAAEATWLKRQARRQRTSLTEVIHGVLRERARATLRAKFHARLRARFPWVAVAKHVPATDAALAEDYLYGEGQPV